MFVAASEQQIARKSRAYAGVVKLADTPDLGSGAARRGGSSPSTRTKNKTIKSLKNSHLTAIS